jgi:hypothetical protein
MKKLLLILILSLSLQSSTTAADDISNFEIEGISVGDSLLKYYNLNQIKKFDRYEYNSKKFYKLGLTDQSLINKLVKYENITFHFKENDNNYIIQHIGGNIFYDKIDDCLNEQKIITKEISEALNVKLIYGEYFDSADKNTKYYQSEATIGKGGVIAITCFDWSKKAKKKGWNDNLSIEIYNSEAADFVRQNS